MAIELVGSLPRAERARGTDPKLPRFGDLAGLRAAGFEACSVAPLRQHCGVGDELVERFAADPAPGRPRSFFTYHLVLPFPVCLGCGDHGTVLEVMDRSSYRFFKLWLLAQHFVDAPKRRYFQARLNLAPVLDPMQTMWRVNRGKRRAEVLDVYCPAGLHVTMVPKTMLTHGTAPEQVSFLRAPADPQVTRDGLKMLGQAGRFVGW